MTVRQMLASMDSVELSEWIVMENIDWWTDRLTEADRRSNEMTQKMFSKAISQGRIKHG